MKRNLSIYQPGFILLLLFLTGGLAACSGGESAAPVTPANSSSLTAIEGQLNNPPGTLTTVSSAMARTAVVSPLPFGTESPTCTHTAAFWAAFPERWLTDNIQIGGLIFTRAQVEQILEHSSSDPIDLVLQQFFATTLNLLQGSDATSIESDLADASAWLERHPRGSFLSVTERSQALELANRLQAYNAGRLGPPLCADEPPTPTPSATATSLPTPRVPPRPIQSSTPSRPTDSSGSNDGETENTPVAPTVTPQASTPTQRSTNTQPAPTDAPAPSPTDEPTPTDAPLGLAVIDP